MSIKSHIRSFFEYPFVRIILVVLLTALSLHYVQAGNWVWAGLTGMALCVVIWWAVGLYHAQTKKVIYMLEALENNDNGLRFHENTGIKTSRTINKLINKVTQILYDAKRITVQQEKYYELILSCINTGIIVLNDTGYIYQKNDEALRLLGINIFTHIRQLSKVDSILMEKLAKAVAGDKLQIVFNNERGSINLSVRVSDIMVNNEHLRIMALSDINNELDEREIDSWIRLTRVLTHEIMNSVTPITSLSDTLLTLSATKKDEEIRNGLQTISTTGKSLLSFVDSYRKFTRIPTPEPSLFYVKPFVDRMLELTKHQNVCDNIDFNIEVSPTDLILYADESLISQVMINLLKNAIQAISDIQNGNITIRAFCNVQDEIFIEVTNNGQQIPPEIAEQIFIPFFTTKEGGNGIGLSLSRQIMRLSGGSLTLLPGQSSADTTFRLRFK